MNFAFDIGGTNMRAAEIKGGKLGRVKKILTPADPNDGIDKLTDLIFNLAEGETVEMVTGGVAGTFDKAGAIFRSPNLPGWHGLNLAKELCKRFSSARVTVINDAALAGLGESVFGAGRGANNIAYVGIGTGIGGASIENAKIDQNAGGFEPGQMIINGKTFESQIAGAGLMAEYGERAEKLPVAVFEERTPILAAALYDIIMLWSPEVLVLGGSLMNETHGYRIERIREEIAKLPTVFAKMPEIRMSELKDASALYGAIAYNH